MVSAPKPIFMNAVELLDMPDDGKSYDLVRGELIGMPPPSSRHAKDTGRIFRHIDRHVEEGDLGVVFTEGGFLLASDPDTVLAPDVAFVRKDRLPPENEWDGYLALAPDLVVEVLSPSERAGAIDDKVLLYLDAGVRLIWLVDSRRRTIMVYTPDHLARLLTIEDVLDGDDVLPGFRLPLAEFFA